MIYDCFIFNSEIDLLILRLEYLYPYVDKFVIVESNQTLTGIIKPLYFAENREKFNNYLDKIIYLLCPADPKLTNPWDYESYQRNFIKNGLTNCNDNDLILISDVDEILDHNFISNHIEEVKKPTIVELDMFYYFFNLKAKYSWNRFLISPYLFLKNFHLGDRLSYNKLNPIYLKKRDKPLGYHFSYLFGNNIELYQQKIVSFSHQEYNNSYYLNITRIKTCINIGIDLFERIELEYTFYNPKQLLSKNLFDKIIELNLQNFIFNRKIIHVFSRKYIKYFFKFKAKPVLSKWIRSVNI